MNKLDLRGKRIIVTGASRGLGLATAKVLHAAGAELLLVSRNMNNFISANLTTVFNDPALSRIKLEAANVSKRKGINFLAMDAGSTWESIDGLVNNAATQGPIGPFANGELEDFRETIHTNLWGPICLCRAIIPLMNSGGSIVNISGGGATSPRPNYSAYATSKAALVAFSATLAEELKDQHIRVNCVAPGRMGTDMMRATVNAGVDACGDAEYDAATEALMAVDDGTARPAELIGRLLSDEYAGITGRLISAVWDDWDGLPAGAVDLTDTDIYTVRRIVPSDRPMYGSEDKG